MAMRDEMAQRRFLFAHALYFTEFRAGAEMLALRAHENDADGGIGLEVAQCGEDFVIALHRQAVEHRWPRQLDDAHSPVP